MKERRRIPAGRRRALVAAVGVVAVILPFLAGPLGADAASDTSTSSSTSVSSSSSSSSTSTSSPSSSSSSTSTSSSSSTSTEPRRAVPLPEIPRGRPGPLPGVPVGQAAPLNAQELADLRAGSDAADSEGLDLLQRVLDAQTALDAARGEVGQVDDQLAAAQDELRATVNRVVELEGRVRRSNEALSQAERDLSDAQVQLRTYAVAAYVGGGRDLSAAAAVLTAQTVDEVGSSRVYASVIVTDQQRLIDHFADLKDQVGKLRQQANDDKARAGQARDQLVRTQADLDKQRAEKASRQSDAERAAADQARALGELENRRGEFADRVANLQSSSSGIENLLKARQSGQTLPSDTQGIFPPPVVGARLTSRFGARTDPISGSSGFHPGLDLAAPTGTEIRAPADAVVVLAQPYGGYGNFTVLDHGNGITTCYGHQSAIQVQVGDRVTKGQVIGRVGSTGYSTGPHLHWEVRIFGVVDDPAYYLGSW